MDGAYEFAPVEKTVTVRGRTFRLLPLRYADEAECEALLVSRKKRPLAIVKEHLAGLDLEQQKYLLALAYRDERDGMRCAPWEMNEWEEKTEGIVWQFWLCARKRHPDLTLEVAEDIVNAHASEVRAALKAVAEQEQPIGNPTGAAAA